MTSNKENLGLTVTHLTKNVLTAEEAELYELSNLAGIVWDQNVFKIIVDLLRLNVAPTAIERMLKSMLSKNKRLSTSESSSHSSRSKSGHSTLKHS